MIKVMPVYVHTLETDRHNEDMQRVFASYTYRRIQRDYITWRGQKSSLNAISMMRLGLLAKDLPFHTLT
jgi:hypothetical protein